MTPEERQQQLYEIAGDYASAKSAMDYLDHFRKSKLAMLTKEILVNGGSFAAAENEARTHQEYLDVLHGLREATEKSTKLYWHLRIADRGIDIWQSKQATARAEMKNLNT
jgi:hypothetical protein